MEKTEEKKKELFLEIDRRRRLGQFIRLKGNNYAVTGLTLVNVLILAPFALWTWLGPIVGSEHSETWLLNLNWLAMYLLWSLPFLTWHYSTITYPVYFSKKIQIDWSRSKKGRIISLALNLPVFVFMGWAANTKYALERYADKLLSIKMDPGMYPNYLNHDLDSLLTLIYVAPVVLTAVLGFYLIRHCLKNKEIFKKQFLTWETPVLARFSHPLEVDQCDVLIGHNHDTKQPIVLKEKERFLHDGTIGATGTGKTSLIFYPRMAQDLIQLSRGKRKMGMVFLGPKGEGVEEVATLARTLGVPEEKILLIDPTSKESIQYNPFAGPMDKVVSSVAATFDMATADQDAFFKGQQNEAVTFYTKLGKITFGDQMNFAYFKKMFTDPRYTADLVEESRRKINLELKNPLLTGEMRRKYEEYDDVMFYFENEVLEYQTYRANGGTVPLRYEHPHPDAGKQIVGSKKDKYVTGVRKYVNELAMNPLLSSLFAGDAEMPVFDPDEFLQEGGVLLVNTALGELDELSSLYGQFFIRQFQSAVFRRPLEGRIPIFLYIDEFSQYVNESFVNLLTMGRSYKVGVSIILQSIGQLDGVKKGLLETILANLSSKAVFGRGTTADNEYFSKEFGEEVMVEESRQESHSPLAAADQSWNYRSGTAKKLTSRFNSTDIRETPAEHVIVQIVNERNNLQPPTKAVLKFVQETKLLVPYLKIRNEKLDFYQKKSIPTDSGKENAEEETEILTDKKENNRSKRFAEKQIALISDSSQKDEAQGYSAMTQTDFLLDSSAKQSTTEEPLALPSFIEPDAVKEIDRLIDSISSTSDGKLPDFSKEPKEQIGKGIDVKKASESKDLFDFKIDDF